MSRMPGRGLENYMKATGIIRNIDELGRIVIPKELRRTLGIENTDPVEIFSEGDKIIVKKYHPSCHFCGKTNNIRDFKGKLICQSCIDELFEQNH